MAIEDKRSDNKQTGRKQTNPDKQPSKTDRSGSEPTDSKKRKTAHPNVRVWRGDRQMKKSPPEQKEEHESKDSQEEQLREKTGRKLWLKVGDSGEVKKQKPPAGHEKHRHLTSYRAEEQDEKRRKIAEYRQKRKQQRRMAPKPEPRPVKPEEVPPDEDLNRTPIEAVYTIGLHRTSPQKFMQKLADAGISLVFDLRSDEAMFAPGFAKGRDLAILLKEAAGIDYRRDEVLVPRRELVQRYAGDKNLARYMQNYAYQLSRGRVEKIIDRDLFVKNKVALIGEAKKAAQDQRLVAAEYFKECWQIYNIVEL